jgi:hypothetical protein
LQTVFENTIVGDVLRTKLVHLAVDNIESLRHDYLAVSMLSKHESLAWSLCQKFRPGPEEGEDEFYDDLSNP